MALVKFTFYAMTLVSEVVEEVYNCDEEEHKQECNSCEVADGLLCKYRVPHEDRDDQTDHINPRENKGEKWLFLQTADDVRKEDSCRELNHGSQDGSLIPYLHAQPNVPGEREFDCIHVLCHIGDDGEKYQTDESL